jgi:adenylate kinase family enzyme
VCLNDLLEPYRFLNHPFTHTVTYKETSMPVIEHYKKQGKVVEVRLEYTLSLACLIRLIHQIDSTPKVEEVHKVAVAAVEKVLV